MTLVSFGDEADVTIQTLIGVLGPPDVDTGWQDPTDPANELWPGCPGATARALQWTGNIGAVFTDRDGDLSKAGGTVSEPYFAGYGLWLATSIPTLDGGSPGSTLAEARAIYGDRLWVSDQPDGAVELYSLANRCDREPADHDGADARLAVPSRRGRPRPLLVDVPR